MLGAICNAQRAVVIQTGNQINCLQKTDDNDDSFNNQNWMKGQFLAENNDKDNHLQFSYIKCQLITLFYSTETLKIIFKFFKSFIVFIILKLIAMSIGQKVKFLCYILVKEFEIEILEFLSLVFAWTVINPTSKRHEEVAQTDCRN